MSRASTAKPPALAMPSRRAAVSAGFPVRRRRPDLATAAIRANTREPVHCGQAPFFYAFFPSSCCQKAATSLSMDCAAACSAYVRDGQGRARGPEGVRRQDRLCGERCRMVRKAVARLVPLPVEREAACGAGPGGTGRLLRMDGETPSGSRLAERLLPHGAIVSPCAVVPPSSAAGGATGKIFRFFMH